MSNAPTISVALCTYNGAAFLPAQWASLCQQTQLPDEVVVCDDGSTDETLTVLAALATDAPFRVRIEPNPTRLGYNKNFELALSHCTGDLIFLCDQDDAWLPHKIRTMVNFMGEHPATRMAFCNAQLTDEHLNPQSGFFWEKVRFDKAARQRWRAGYAMDVLLDGNRVMGCASVVRRGLLTNALPIPAQVPGYIYDGWLALIAAGNGGIQFINQSLQLYRTHPSQQVGVRLPTDSREPIGLGDRFSRPRPLKLDPLRHRADQYRTLLDLLTPRLSVDAPGLVRLNWRWQHYQMRSTLPDNRLSRSGPVLTNLFGGAYHRYADEQASWTAPYLAALGDILE